MVQHGNVTKQRGTGKFQYILCCGSTIPPFYYFVAFLDFNTSYVVVQQTLNRTDCGRNRISIHLMLWFNSKTRSTMWYAFRISIHLMLWFNLLHTAEKIDRLFHFNTSYVVVQLTGSDNNSGAYDISIHLMLWFNGRIEFISVVEPHISIHLMLWFNNVELTDSAVNDCYFNTSYVVVQQGFPCVFIIAFLISIHLMLWFN